ncbi:glycosyltransferase [Sphingomonas sp.]|uniref:glycosyltransferase n=1 Tax=Sphingomonas sp. TaxID=28214 RepID=UPI0025DDD15F|nr:glycosyltransferase [Sphingomonas sp.]
MNNLIDVDFSLAIHNRTGKYFIGRDLLDSPDLPIGDVYYWWIRGQQPPARLFGRIVGRLQHWHITGRTIGGPLAALPGRRSSRPLLHLDPFTVPTTQLRSQDAVLCHDIGPVTHPQLFDPDVGRIYAHIYRTCERVGPHLIFVSETSRAAFIGAFPGANADKMRVIYPATRAGIVATLPAPVRGVDGPYLLTVGSVGDRKNQARCIAAFAESGLAAQGYRYVICGGREPGFEHVEAATRGVAGVICLSYVSDAELSWLYGNAAGFVLVSLLEGFGMPVAEAVARDLVPLVSRDSVLHEVAGDGALLADPLDIPSIAAGMTALAAMSPTTRARHLLALKQSTARFDIGRIQAAWRSALGEILARSDQ